ncbi:hypothetical protein Tco_1405819 [Tanacetum coccineum]
MLERYTRIAGLTKATSGLEYLEYEDNFDPEDKEWVLIQECDQSHVVFLNSSCNIPTNTYAVNNEKYILEQVEATQGKQRTSSVITCKGEGHYFHAVYYATREKRDETWFNVKAVRLSSSLSNADDLDAYDSDCDELNSAKIALMAESFGNVPIKALTTELDSIKEEVKDLKEI